MANENEIDKVYELHRTLLAVVHLIYNEDDAKVSGSFRSTTCCPDSGVPQQFFQILQTPDIDGLIRAEQHLTVARNDALVYIRELGFGEMGHG